jgi:hypothetical protein
MPTEVLGWSPTSGDHPFGGATDLCRRSISPPWIGSYEILTKSAGAKHVPKSLLPHSICAGTPAKVISFKSYLSEKRRAELQDEFEGVIK